MFEQPIELLLVKNKLLNTALLHYVNANSNTLQSR